MAHELRQSYANLVDAKLRASLITKSLFNTKYEGVPTAGAVKIPVRDGEVSVGDYSTTNIGSNAVSYGSTQYLTAVIDADKFVDEYIDGYEADAVPDNLVADRLESAGYSLANGMDTQALTTLVNACEGKDKNGTSFATGDVRKGKTGTKIAASASIFDDIVDLGVAMDNAMVPADGRWLIVTAEAYGELVKSEDFIKQSNLSQELVMSGAVGMIAGFAIYKCPKLKTIKSTFKAIGGHSLFCTRIEAWKVEPKLVDGNGDANVVGGSFIKGRKIYTHEVTKPHAFAYIATA